MEFVLPGQPLGMDRDGMVLVLFGPIGHDSAVSFVGIASRSRSSVRPLDGMFYEFIPRAWRDPVIVFHELGAVKFDLLGTPKSPLTSWNVGTC